MTHTSKDSVNQEVFCAKSYISSYDILAGFWQKYHCSTETAQLGEHVKAGFSGTLPTY